MAVWQGNSKRSMTGRRIRYARNKRRFEIGRENHLTTIGAMKRKPFRTRGNNKKSRVLTADAAYVVDPKTNKTVKTEIVTEQGCDYQHENRQSKNNLSSWTKRCNQCSVTLEIKLSWFEWSPGMIKNT
jgi:ribosomal protein S8E